MDIAEDFLYQLEHSERVSPRSNVASGNKEHKIQHNNKKKAAAPTWHSRLFSTMTETVGASLELLGDSELRKRAVPYVFGNSHVQRGISSAAALGRQIQQGLSMVNKQQIQVFISQLEQKISDYSHQRQLNEHRKQLVDVQVGRLLLRDVPQEVRTRLWFLLLQNPAMAEPLKSLRELAQWGEGLAAVADTEEVGTEALDPTTNGTPAAAGPIEGSEAAREQQTVPSSSTAAAAAAAAAAAGTTLDQWPAPKGHQSSSAAAVAATTSPKEHISMPGRHQSAAAVAGTPQEHLRAGPGSPNLGGDSTSTTGGGLNVSTRPSPLNDSQDHVGAGSGSRPKSHKCHSPVQGDVSKAAARVGAGDVVGASVRKGVGKAAPSVGEGGVGGVGVSGNKGMHTGASVGEGGGVCVSDQEDEDAVLQLLEDRRTRGVSASSSCSMLVGVVNKGGKEAARHPQGAGRKGTRAQPEDASDCNISSTSRRGSTPAPSAFHAAPSGGHASTSSATGASKRGAEGGGSGEPEMYESENEEGEDWEMVDTEGLAYKMSPCRPQEAQAANRRHLFKLLQRRIERMDGAYDDYRDDPAARAALHVDLHVLVEALMGVPWTPEQGLSVPCPSESPLALLNEIPPCIDQQEINEIIMRDINRTFPEHPFFGSSVGQTSLFRILKAYSMQDLEAGYCQGMAFAAGVLLMFLPEEPAFRLYGRLMGPNGPNLRRLYLPGLDALKVELACFDWLLVSKQPELQQHLHALCVPPVLYVSQWLMTVFAQPFPPTFAARIIDIMLQEGSDAILLRISYAIVDRLRPQLMAMDNFEAVLTTIKVTPLQWSLQEQREVMAQALQNPITDEDLKAARASTCTMLASAMKQLRGVDISLKGLAVEDVDAAKAQDFEMAAQASTSTHTSAAAYTVPIVEAKGEPSAAGARAEAAEPVRFAAIDRPSTSVIYRPSTSATTELTQSTAAQSTGDHGSAPACVAAAQSTEDLSSAPACVAAARAPEEGAAAMTAQRAVEVAAEEGAAAKSAKGVSEDAANQASVPANTLYATGFEQHLQSELGQEQQGGGQGGRLQQKPDQSHCAVAGLDQEQQSGHPKADAHQQQHEDGQEVPPELAQELLQGLQLEDDLLQVLLWLLHQ